MDMKMFQIDVDNWESTAGDRDAWRFAGKKDIKIAEATRISDQATWQEGRQDAEFFQDAEFQTNFPCRCLYLCI